MSRDDVLSIVIFVLNVYSVNYGKKKDSLDS